MRMYNEMKDYKSKSKNISAHAVFTLVALFTFPQYHLDLFKREATGIIYNDNT